MSDDSIDYMLGPEAFETCSYIIDEGVDQTPPVVGQSYTAFGVHPPQPNGLVVIAIGHCEGEKYHIDLVKDGLSIADASKELKRYGIAKVTGAESDSIDEDGMAHAVFGVISILYDRMSRS